LGLFEPVPDNPFAIRFTHDLVRDAVAGTVPPMQVSRLNLHIAEALVRTCPAASICSEQLANHLWAAGPLADPARTAGALLQAGQCASRKLVFDLAERHLTAAAHVARAAGLAELELAAHRRFAAIVRLWSVRAGPGLRLLERGEELARDLDRQPDAACFLFARWTICSLDGQNHVAEYLARKLLGWSRSSADPVVQDYGALVWGLHHWHTGQIGECFRYLSRSTSTALAKLDRHLGSPLQQANRLFYPAIRAIAAAVHGDPCSARAQLEALEAVSADNPYAITVWAAFASTIAVLRGDAAEALRVADLGIAIFPGWSIAHLHTHTQVNRCWALAVMGTDPAEAAAEAQRVLDAIPPEETRSGLASHFARLAELYLLAERPAEAARALDRAEGYLATYGQRFAEGLVLVNRARLARALGEPEEVVRAAIDRAAALATEREAFLFVREAEALRAELDG
ncbi:hypothetical protein, partial [Crossiella equi]